MGSLARIALLFVVFCLTACEITALSNDELRARAPSEDFVLKGDLSCVYERTTAYVATVISGFDKDFRGYIAPSRQSAWLRHPLVLFDLDALKEGGTRVRRWPVDVDGHFGDGKQFSEWLKKVDCPAPT